MKPHEDGYSNRLGGQLLSDGEILDLVYAWLAMEGTIPELKQLLHDNEEEDYE